MEFEDLKRQCISLGIPIPPAPVSGDDCCGDGCIPCIIPKYNEDLMAWGKQLESIDLTDPEVLALVKACKGKRKLRVGTCII